MTPTDLGCDVQAPAGEVVGHCNVFGQPKRIPVRQHQPHLSLPQPLRMLREVHVEHQGIGGYVIALDFEMMFGEHHRGPAGFVCANRLLAQLVYRSGVTRPVQPPQTFAKLGFRRHGYGIEHAKFHGGASRRDRFAGDRLELVRPSGHATDHCRGRCCVNARCCA